jgi:drug/metabolite transporter (DMT)-like permease
LIIVYSKLLLMVILTSLSQVFIKIGSRKIITNSGLSVLIKTFLNYNILIGITFVVAAPLLYFSALSSVPLNIAFSVNGLGYIIVILLSKLVLKEHVSVFHIAGGILILGGFMVWNLGAGIL